MFHSLRFFVSNFTRFVLAVSTGGSSSEPTPPPSLPPTPGFTSTLSDPSGTTADLLRPLHPFGGLPSGDLEDEVVHYGKMSFFRTIPAHDYTPLSSAAEFSFCIIDPLALEEASYSFYHFSLVEYLSFSLVVNPQAKGVGLFARLFPRSSFDLWRRDNKDLTKIPFSSWVSLGEGVDRFWPVGVTTGLDGTFNVPVIRELLTSSPHGGLPGASSPVLVFACSSPSSLVGNGLDFFLKIKFVGRGRGNWKQARASFFTT
jgi:hypothetical protein